MYVNNLAPTKSAIIPTPLPKKKHQQAPSKTIEERISKSYICANPYIFRML